MECYYGAIVAEAEKVAPPCSVVFKKGDCAIWHPMLPHGGTKANNPMLTRKSMVFHCAPIDVQVYQQDVFSPPTSNRSPAMAFANFASANMRWQAGLASRAHRGIKFNHMDEMFGKPAAPVGKQFSWQGKAVS